MNDEVKHDTTPPPVLMLRQAMQSRQAPRRVEEALRREFRAHHHSRRSVRTWWRPWAVAAAAAAATVVLAVLMIRPQPFAPEPVAAAAQELTTDYIPVGYGQPLDPDEFAQVVRISVPRSEMVRFGLPVRLEASPQRVIADVVLGEDGVARAIRFVE